MTDSNGGATGEIVPTTSLAQLRSIEQRVLVPAYSRLPVTFVRGSGTRLWDDEGEEYLDAQSGLGVTSLGHSHPRVVAAISEQAARLIHIGNLVYSEPAMRLAERLADSSLGGRVHFANSGTEAVEAALKMARKAKRGGEVVSIHSAFHGRTFGSLSATPQEAKQAPFAPLVPGFRAVAAEPQALAEAITPATAAVILEPIQGEGGVYVLADELLLAARERCDAVGATLIFDEVQCGLGRTGSVWAYQQTPVVPDLITTAKALANGLPIGAVITAPRLGDVFEPGDHGSTFAGGPVQCAAALAVMDAIEEPELLRSVRTLGEYLREAVAELPHVVSVRGRGLMVGIDLQAQLFAPDIVACALSEQRLLLNATGPSTLRLLPPLILSREDADEVIRRLGNVLRGQ